MQPLADVLVAGRAGAVERGEFCEVVAVEVVRFGDHRRRTEIFEVPSQVALLPALAELREPIARAERTNLYRERWAHEGFGERTRYPTGTRNVSCVIAVRYGFTRSSDA